MLEHLRPALVLLLLFTPLTGLAYPLALLRLRRALCSRAGRRQPGDPRRQGGRLRADRPELRLRESIFSRAPPRPARPIRTTPARRSTRPTTPTNSSRLESRADRKALVDRVKADADVRRQAAGKTPLPADRDDLGIRPRPRHLPRLRAGQVPAPRGNAQSATRRRFAPWSTRTSPRDAVQPHREPRVNVLLLKIALDGGMAHFSS